MKKHARLIFSLAGNAAVLLLVLLMFFQFLQRGSYDVYLPFTVASLIVAQFAIGLLLQEWRNPTAKFRCHLTGKKGNVVTAFTPRGQVKIGPEVWNAVCRDGTRLKRGQSVIVIERNGLLLTVSALDQKSNAT